MPETILTTLLTGAFALLCALIGGLTSHWLSTRHERRRWEREDRERILRERKDAYCKLLVAASEAFLTSAAEPVEARSRMTQVLVSLSLVEMYGTKDVYDAGHAMMLALSDGLLGGESEELDSVRVGTLRRQLVDAVRREMSLSPLRDVSLSLDEPAN